MEEIFKKKWYVFDYYQGDSIWIGFGSSNPDKANLVCDMYYDKRSCEDEKKIAERIVDLHNKSLEKKPAPMKEKEWGEIDFKTFEDHRENIFVRIKDLLKMLSIIIENKGHETTEIAVFCCRLMNLFEDLNKGHRK